MPAQVISLRAEAGVRPTSSADRRRAPQAQRWVLMGAVCHAARHFPRRRHHSFLRSGTLATRADGLSVFRYVNGNRKLTSWRQVKIDHLRGLGFVGRGGGDAAEVSVFESVAVSFEGDDFGVVDEAVDHGGGAGGRAQSLAPAAREAG